MGNSSHSGIDIRELEISFNDFINTSFPEAPEDDDLYDIYSDLVEYDSHIAGIVSSLLGGKKVNKSLIFLNDDLEKKINANGNNSELKDIREYKNKIDNLVMLIIKK
ncbi:hypothetical protein [Bacillus alkalicellulosilyticus]|uniref:hypothetical protein n=1 Tax=Alkalihalobacterium alkalicellulosilyticum TaxID=1912214 RepID=UPI000996977E|nr:hypothetical protein [Bacillus alkalicellulosilyticus]